MRHRRRPRIYRKGIEPTSPEIIRDTLLRRLYNKQEEYWRRQLKTIVLRNAHYHAVAGEKYGIHYLGKDWYPYDDATKAFDGAYYDLIFLPLHPDYAPQIEKKLLAIINELAQLEAEEYECSRFLSGLVLFPAPLDVFQTVLGTQLFQECEKELAQHTLTTTDFVWDSNAYAALSTYVAQHDYILKAMRQRLLTNMITRDQIRQ